MRFLQTTYTYIQLVIYLSFLLLCISLFVVLCFLNRLCNTDENFSVWIYFQTREKIPYYSSRKNLHFPLDSDKVFGLFIILEIMCQWNGNSISIIFDSDSYIDICK